MCKYVVASLFLPFTPQGRITELAAIAIKRHLGLRPDDPVDPFAVLPDVPARLVDSSLFDAALLADCVHEWSSVGFGCAPRGEELICLNPTHAATRQRATLMEEIVHIVLDHPKTTVTVHPDATIGSVWSVEAAPERTAVGTRAVVAASVRTFGSTVDDDAFNIGAACVVPYRRLFDAVHARHEDVTLLATRYQASEEFMTYRIKRAGLSKMYRKHHPPDP